MPGGRFKRATWPGWPAGSTTWPKTGRQTGERPNRPSGYGQTARVVHDDLARPVGFSTTGMTPGAALEKITQRLSLPVELAGNLPTSGDEKIAEELSGLSCARRWPVSCAWPDIARAAPDGPRPGLRGGQGPVGPGGVARRLAAGEAVHPDGPRHVRVSQRQRAERAGRQGLETLSKMSKVPIFVDDNALARHGIDPTKAMVAMPRRRRPYNLASRSCLFKAGPEVRGPRGPGGQGIYLGQHGEAGVTAA